VCRLQNNAARIVLQAPRRSHASPLLRMLHWLPFEAKDRVQSGSADVQSPQHVHSGVTSLPNPGSTITCDRPPRRCVNRLRRRHSQSAPSSAQLWLSGTRYRKLFSTATQLNTVFTARSYASAVYAVTVCLSVSPSVRLPVCHTRIVAKWLNVESRKQRHTIAQGL